VAIVERVLITEMGSQPEQKLSEQSLQNIKH